MKNKIKRGNAIAEKGQKKKIYRNIFGITHSKKVPPNKIQSWQEKQTAWSQQHFPKKAQDLQLRPVKIIYPPNVEDKLKTHKESIKIMSKKDTYIPEVKTFPNFAVYNTTQKEPAEG